MTHTLMSISTKMYDINMPDRTFLKEKCFSVAQMEVRKSSMQLEIKLQENYIII